jgi:NTE family protein
MKSAFSIVTQFSSLLVVRNTQTQIDDLRATDVLIRPQLGQEITSASFDRFEQALPLGYAAVVNAEDSLAALSVSEAEYQQWRQQISDCTRAPGRVDFVRLNNQSRYSDNVIFEQMTFQPGGELDEAQIQADLDRIHSLGFVRLARHRMVMDGDREGVEIQVFDDQRGANMLETGLTVTGDDRQTSFNLQAAYLKTNLDQRGSEFRGLVQIGDTYGIEADLYKYLDDRRSWYLNPETYWGERRFKVFNDEHATAEVNLKELGLGLRFGHEFNRQSNLSMGLRRFKGELSIAVGQPLPADAFDGGEWDLQYIWDSLDDLFLPTRGTRAFARYIQSSEKLGADEDFDQVELSLLSSKTWGLHSVQLVSRLNTSLSDDIPDYALFTGGGFLNMSGFEPNQLIGEHFGMLGIGYRYQLGKSGLLPGYAGTTIEYGNAGDDRSDVFGDGVFNGSVYFGYNTPLGPLYLGYGFAEDRSGVLFFSLGAVLGVSSVGRR